MNQNRNRWGAVMILMLAIAACSSGARRVNCDRHLVPINPPAPVTKIATAKTKSP
jgi:hypothetical protein